MTSIAESSHPRPLLIMNGKCIILFNLKLTLVIRNGEIGPCVP